MAAKRWRLYLQSAGNPGGGDGVLRPYCLCAIYWSDIYRLMLTPELKKGSAEFLVLSLLRHEARHGYDLSKLIEVRSGGVVQFQVSSLYPLLYRMERRGWIRGRWVEKAGQRRRRYYSLTAAGQDILEAQRESWLEFVQAIGRVAGLTHA